MAEQLGDLTRTHTCGALRSSDVGATVVLLGWVHRVRDLGGLLFVDIRDREGVTQVVFDNDDAAQMAKAKRVRSEYVIGVSGRVRRRSADTARVYAVRRKCSGRCRCRAWRRRSRPRGRGRSRR